MADIIGIDIGTLRMGLARLSGDRLIASEQVHFMRNGKWLRDRMLLAMRVACDFARLSRPHNEGIVYHVFIERIPYVQNYRTYGTLCRFLGAIEAAVGQDPMCRSITLLSPAEIKAAFTGNGHASKAEVQRVATLQFGGVYGEDEADAIATAWAGLVKVKEQEMVAK